MLKNNLMLLSPFRVMGYDNENIIPEGGLGAVAAQVGVGKTALLVQLALNAMMRDQKVLHISLQDPVNKVSLWYHELFNNIAQQAQVAESAETWEVRLLTSGVRMLPVTSSSPIQTCCFRSGESGERRSGNCPASSTMTLSSVVSRFNWSAL